MSGADDAESIDRPRFLGLGEFGPRNIIYHEGRRHRIAGLVVPAGGIEGRLKRARLCRTCGYLAPMPGLCIFVDGPAHDEANQKAHDRQVRADLEDRGFRVVVIRYDRSIDDQLDTLREALAT